LFLLIVFGFNTVVGFACAIGLDMGFKTDNGHYENAPKIHVHVDGEKHDHKKKDHKHSKNNHDKKASKIHVHADGKKHDHKNKEHKHSEEKGKDDCCNDKILKISQADKAIPQLAKLLNPAFFTAVVAVYFHINVSYSSRVNTSTRYFVRGHHPPIADIRIAIRSFQI